MSLRCMTWVFHESESRGYDRLVLLALADEADDDGANCFPGQRRIAEKARIGVGTVPAVVRRLEESGEIVVRRPERRGRGLVFSYVLVMGREKSSVPEPFLPAGNARKSPINARKRAEPLPKTALTHIPVEPANAGSRPAPSVNDIANSIVKDWWEERKAADRPVAQGFMACRGVVAGALRNGVPAEDLAWALRHAPSVSGGTIEFALSQRRSNSKRPASEENLITDTSYGEILL